MSLAGTYPPEAAVQISLRSYLKASCPPLSMQAGSKGNIRSQPLSVKQKKGGKAIFPRKRPLRPLPHGAHLQGGTYRFHSFFQKDQVLGNMPCKKGLRPARKAEAQ